MDKKVDKSSGTAVRSALHFVRVRGAREHNLKNVDVDIPRDSLVVFTGNGQFKTRVPERVLSLAELVTYIAGHAAEVMSINRVQFCVGRLETTRLALTKTTDVEHVQLRHRYRHDQ